MRIFIWAALLAIGVWLLGLVFWTGQLRRETNSLAVSANTFSAAVNQLQDNIRRNAPTSTLIFVGDIMLSRNIGKKMENLGDWEFPFKKIKKYLSEADFAFGNLESPISDKGSNQGSIYSFRADPRAVLGLQTAGLDAVSLANNHIWDWGVDALSDTVTKLKEVGIIPLGVGENKKEANAGHIFKINGTKIGFLAYTDLYSKSLIATEKDPGISDWSRDQVLSDIKRLKVESDLLLVSWHSGTEYEKVPNVEQKEIYKWLIAAGVDLVVGHHPHVTQPVEEYGGGWIAYSLGNFIFDQSFSKETMEGMALEVSIRNEKITKVETRKVILDHDFQPSLEGI
jgi:poly-gamma-glutamate synthesis protein (capsule biosynthesis protein)